MRAGAGQTLKNSKVDRLAQTATLSSHGSHSYCRLAAGSKIMPVKMESSDDEIVPGTNPQGFLSPPLLKDGNQDVMENVMQKAASLSSAANDQQQQHKPSPAPASSPPSYSYLSGSQRFDDGPQSSESPPPSQQSSSNAVPVTDHKKGKEDESSEGEGGPAEKDKEGQAKADQTPSTAREAAIQSFHDSWPAFAAATDPAAACSSQETECPYAYSHRIPDSIAAVLGPPIKELDFESERKLWEQYRERARDREAAARAARAAGTYTDPSLERAKATLREDEKFRRDGIRMQERQERWDRGEYSDHDSEEGAEETAEDSGDARIRAKVRERLRKPGAPAPTIAEMASIMGLRPAPCAVDTTIQDIDGDDVNIVPGKKQTLLAPLPDRTDWQKSRKEGRRRSSTGSGSSSDAHVSGNDRGTAEAAAAAAAQPTSGAKRSKVKASTSSRKRKKPKKSSSSGAGSSFMHKLRRKKDKGDRYHTQTDEEDEETYPTKPSSSGKSDRRIFDQTPKRKDENLTQTSIQDMFASGGK